MHRTIFDTPGINRVFRALSAAVLRLSGWKVEGRLPADVGKCVVIAAPHTSNWDLPYTLMVAFALRLNIYWMGKEQIFKPPFRGLMQWLGGISVNRQQATNMVAASVEAIVAADGRALARALRIAGKVEPIFVDDILDLPQAAIDNARDGDVLMCMGAGSIGAVPGKIAEMLQKQELLAQKG